MTQDTFEESLNSVFNEWDTLRIECGILMRRNKHHRYGVDRMIYTKSGQRDVQKVELHTSSKSTSFPS